MNVEELDETALESAAQLWELTALTRPWNDPREDFRRALRGTNSCVLGTFEGDDLVGTVMVGADGHRGWMYYVAVAPSHQRRGIGRSLVRAAEQWLVQRDVPKVQLMVRQTNADAEKFYERLGYQDAHTTVLGRWLHESP
ncbi:MAG: GNAT family acetyltransferase [Acidimicrobiales bacterium]